MKKYPFSNKTMKAIMAAAIVLAPLAPAGNLLGDSKAYAMEAPTTTCDAIDRVSLIYSKFTTDEKALFEKAAQAMQGSKVDWTTILGATVETKLDGQLNPVTAEQLAKKFAELIYNPNSAQLKSNYTSFLSSPEGKKFEEVMGTGTTNLILKFFVDAEKELWTMDAGTLLSRDARAIETMIADARAELLKDPEYSALNNKLYEVMGTNLEGLYGMKDRINNQLVSNDVLTADQVKILRDAFIIAAVKAGEPTESTTGECSFDTGSGNNGGGGGGIGLPPATPPASGELHVITLPEQAAEVVKENNPSGKVEVITKIVPEKVSEIVKLITAEKHTIQVTLEKPAAGEVAKAQIPAALFTEAAAKNPKAVVEIATQEASYKLPVSEVKIADLAAKLGVTASNVHINVSVNVVNPADVKGAVDKNKLKLTSDVIEFTVEAAGGDKKEAVSKFSKYVEREIVGDAAFNKEKSVAVKLNANGTISSIPTLFDGKTATIKSLTNSKYTIVENNVTFSDVKSGWAKEYIDTLAAKYIVFGKSTGEYEPTKHMTRAEFAVLLVRALGLPTEKYDGSFKDVKGHEWFAKNGELTAAVKYGVSVGMGDGTFAPNEKITRAQAAAMIERAMKIPFLQYDFSNLDKTKTLKDFSDSKQMASWAKTGVEKAYQAGIFKGKGDGTFNPNGYTQRNEMAAILANFLVSADLMDDTFSN